MTNLDTLLIEAMQSELEAMNFYEQAARKAQSKAGKKLFEELAEFEQNHYKRVSSIIDARKSNKTVEPQTMQDEHIINAEISGEIEPNKDEIISVLTLAIDAEKQAQDRYMKIADLFDDEESKTIFMNLSQEERNHQRILEDEIYQLSNKGTIIWG